MTARDRLLPNPPTADCRYPGICRECQYLLTLCQKQSGRDDNQPVCMLIKCRFKCPIKIIGAPHLQGLNLHVFQVRSPLSFPKFWVGMARIPKNGYAAQFRHCLFEECEHFSGKVVI